MSDQNVDTTEPTQTPEQEEMILLKERAALLNLRVHHNLSLVKLRALVKAASSTDSPVASTGNMTAEQKKLEEKNKLRNIARRLVRIKCVVMNPNKKEWAGEIITVGNNMVGDIKKYVPFDGRIWHVEQAILNVLQERKFVHFYKDKDKLGNDIDLHKEVKEFAIEILAPLTPKELEQMRVEQLNRNNTAT